MGRFLVVALVLFIGACAPAATPRAQTEASAPAAPGAPTARAPKVLRIAVAREPDGFVLSIVPNATRAGGGNQAQSFASNMLQNFDEKGNKYPELAEALPTTADGPWKLNPDGMMETIWKLRPNLKWHDGAPVTADDLLFGYQFMTTPGLPSTSGTYLRNVSEVIALDRLTVLVRWKTLYVDADEPGDNLPVLPRHLLELVPVRCADRCRGSRRCPARRPGSVGFPRLRAGGNNRWSLGSASCPCRCSSPGAGGSWATARRQNRQLLPTSE